MNQTQNEKIQELKKQIEKLQEVAQKLPETSEIQQRLVKIEKLLSARDMNKFVDHSREFLKMRPYPPDPWVIMIEYGPFVLEKGKEVSVSIKKLHRMYVERFNEVIDYAIDELVNITSEISDYLSDILDFNTKLNNLEKRIKELENSLYDP